MRDIINILNVPFDNITYEEALKKAESFIKEKKAAGIVTPNAEIVISANKDQKLYDAICSADISLPDGIGVYLASRILKTPLKQRTTGFDFMLELLKLADKKGYSVYFLGGKPGVANEALANVKKNFPGLVPSGAHHGYFSGSEESIIIEEINKKSPHMVFVGMGAPKQELFISRNKGKVNCGFLMGVGGSLDVLSGRTKRAPLIMQKLGLEWFYRLIKEPYRAKRMTALPLFLLRVICTGKRGKR
ncbi:WecB/TagA/CpsF family glycosyltransferase [Thermovenabulum sp.]|uniref:WecB/TagA/CpsF family glycosyltransferase n=1 Tax=Thermovenabulum sp. TaxID=3100335 RepID=UPI003C7BB441